MPDRDHKCMCERIFSDTKAKLTNLRLVGTVSVDVEEDIRLLLPLSSKCDCYPVNKRVSKPIIEERVVVESEPEILEQPVYKTVQVPVTEYKTVQVPVTKTEQRLVKTTRERVVQADYVTIFISVRNLPKMDGAFGKCDPYYKFFVDGVQVAGSAKDYISDKLSGAWSFKYATRSLNKARKLRIEFWDKDTLQDDFIAKWECDASEFMLKRGFTNIDIKFKKSNKPII